MVGVNDYVTDDAPDVPLLRVDTEGEARQIERLRRVRLRTLGSRCHALPARPRTRRPRTDNLMPPILAVGEGVRDAGRDLRTFRAALW